MGTRRRPVTIITAQVGQEFGRGAVSFGANVFRTRVEGTMVTRGRIPGRIPGLEELVETRLLGARSESTWSGLSQVWKQFLAFAQLNFPEEGDRPSHEVMIMMFIEGKLSLPEKPIFPPTANQYVKRLAQSSDRLCIPYERETLADYRRALKRDGALLPANQATPAVKAQVEMACRLASPDEALGMIAAWKSSSRVGEIKWLTRESFLWVEADKWVVTFPYSKGDPFKLGTALVVHFGEWHERLTEHLHRMGPGAPFSALTTDRAEALLKRVDPTLSAHSIKRGALLTMLRAGVPLHLIQIMAKHKDMETLLVYLPRAEVALALGMDECSQCL